MTDDRIALARCWNGRNGPRLRSLQGSQAGTAGRARNAEHSTSQRGLRQQDCGSSCTCGRAGRRRIARNAWTRRYVPHPGTMPAWTSAVAEAPPTPLSTEAPVAADPRRRGRPRKQIATTPPTRHVADPFDASDDGANCMRCGYLVRQRADRRSMRASAAPGRADRISGTLGEPSAGGSTQGLLPPKIEAFGCSEPDRPMWPSGACETRGWSGTGASN